MALPSNKPQLSALMPEAIDARHVTMSNRLARSAHGLNLAEKRLVALGLAGTDSVPMDGLIAATRNAGWKMKVTAKEYAEAFSVHPTTAYEQLRSASEKLFERYVRFEVKNRRGTTKEEKFRWVSGVAYADGDGYVELNFSPEIAPHLLGLRKHFTSYKLRDAAFDTVYAWRLFELLKSWQSTGLYVTAIEDFWEAMEAPPSCRKDFKALRIRVIEPAVASIKSKAQLMVEWKAVRAGSRRITSLEFRCAPDPQGRLDMGDEPAHGDAAAEAEESTETPQLQIGLEELESD